MRPRIDQKTVSLARPCDFFKLFHFKLVHVIHPRNRFYQSVEVGLMRLTAKAPSSAIYVSRQRIEKPGKRHGDGHFCFAISYLGSGSDLSFYADAHLVRAYDNQVNNGDVSGAD